MKNTTKLLNISMAATLIIGILCLILWIKSPTESSHPAEPAKTLATKTSNPESLVTQTTSVKADVTADPIQSDPFLGYLTSTQEQELKRVATAFINGYNQRTYTDPSATSWLSRATPHTTESYQKELNKRFATASGGKDWQEFLTTKASTTVTGLSLTLIRTNQYAQGSVVLSAAYLVGTQGQDGTVLVAPQRYRKLVTLARESGKWKVSSLDNLTSEPGYVPAD